jgi:hypothetical protein
MGKWLLADFPIHSTFSNRTEAVGEMTKIYGKVDFDLTDGNRRGERII